MTRLQPGKSKKTENSNTFSPIQELIAPGKRWMGVFVFMVLGALAGYGFHLITPPEYSSSAAITFTIDFTRTGELTDVETDIAIVTAGDIVASSAVIENTLEAGYAAGLPEGSFQFETNAFLDRYSFRYELVVENADPKIASQWANLWAEEAKSVLTDARMHALNADNIYKQMLSIQNCLQQPVLQEPVTTSCHEQTLAELQEKLTEFNAAYLEEKESSLGFLPAMDFSLTRNADPAENPGRHQIGVMVLGGALLGGIIFVSWIFFTRRQHRRP